MKRFIGIGFGLAALCACLVWPVTDTYAHDTKQMAECHDGKCTISEEDWKKLQAFHKAVHDAEDRVNAHISEQQQQIFWLTRKLLSCSAILEERKV